MLGLGVAVELLGDLVLVVLLVGVVLLGVGVSSAVVQPARTRVVNAVIAASFLMPFLPLGA